MAVIDIGHGCYDGSLDAGATYTNVDIDNPANESGTLTSFEIWMVSTGSGVKIGTFYGSSTDYTCRDYESIGSVTSGSKQTFTGKNCTVESGDFIGCYSSSGAFEAGSGGSGQYYKNGDHFSDGTQTYALRSSGGPYYVSIYGTGTTSVGWTTAKLGGIASVSIIKVAGIAVASVKKVAGVAVQ